MIPSNPRDKPKIIRSAIGLLTRVLAYFAAFLLVVVLVLVIADISRRALTGQAVRGVVELSEVAMVTIVFLGLPYAEQLRAHVAMTMVVEKLKPRTASMVNAAGLCLIIFIVIWMIWVTTGRAIESFEANEFRYGLARVPVWPARIAIAVGLTVLLMQLVLRLWDGVRVALSADEPKHPTANADPQSTVQL